MTTSSPVLAKTPPNPIDKHVGSRVRLRRMMIGMSQEKLAHVPAGAEIREGHQPDQRQQAATDFADPAGAGIQGASTIGWRCGRVPLGFGALSA
jgi:hypothetical protein